LVGRPDEAVRTAQEAVEHSTRWFHPFTHVWMLTVLCIVRQLRDEPEEIGAVADRMVVLCNDHGFPNWLAQAMVWRGWAIAMLGEPHEGVASMHQGVDIWAMTGSQLIRPYLLGLLADGLRAGGRLDEARETVETALAECERTGELVWHSLVLRIAADIAEASGNDPVPILRRAVAAAESTGAALHEAAARTRLDRLGSKGTVPSGRRDGGSR